jgi:hypothetical protein
MRRWLFSKLISFILLIDWNCRFLLAFQLPIDVLIRPESAPKVRFPIYSLSKQPLLLSMSLVPLSKQKTKYLIPRRVTTDQWRSYWGVTPFERMQKILESLLVAYGGAWIAWFLSFMAGNFVSSLVGVFLIFNWMFTPYIHAKQQNYRMWSTKQGKKLYHAYFKGKIVE